MVKYKRIKISDVFTNVILGFIGIDQFNFDLEFCDDAPFTVSRYGDDEEEGQFININVAIRGATDRDYSYHYRNHTHTSTVFIQSTGNLKNCIITAHALLDPSVRITT